jgi:hypothetical protein
MFVFLVEINLNLDYRFGEGDYRHFFVCNQPVLFVINFVSSGFIWLVSCLYDINCVGFDLAAPMSTYSFCILRVYFFVLQ